MKTYSNIQDWLKSKPEESEVVKVLTLINRGAKREMKKTLYLKQKELNRNLKFVEEMKELGYIPTAEITEKTKALVIEIKELQEAIGPVVKRFQSAKRETVEK